MQPPPGCGRHSAAIACRAAWTPRPACWLLIRPRCDGFHPENVGRLSWACRVLSPARPRASWSCCGATTSRPRAKRPWWWGALRHRGQAVGHAPGPARRLCRCHDHLPFAHLGIWRRNAAMRTSFFWPCRRPVSSPPIWCAKAWSSLMWHQPHARRPLRRRGLRGRERQGARHHAGARRRGAHDHRHAAQNTVDPGAAARHRICCQAGAIHS